MSQMLIEPNATERDETIRTGTVPTVVDIDIANIVAIVTRVAGRALAINVSKSTLAVLIRLSETPVSQSLENSFGIPCITNAERIKGGTSNPNPIFA